MVWGDRVYAWDWEDGDAVVSAYDIETGRYLYCSQGLQYWGPVIQQGLFVGLDGKIYAPRPSNETYENYLYAIEDTGEALVVAWTYKLGPGSSSTHGVGPNGTIFTHDVSGYLIGLDPDTGSRVLMADGPLPGYNGLGGSDFNPRLAVDAQGKVFVGNGSYAAGAIVAYDPSLNLLWSEDLGSQSITGPALSSTGELVVQTRNQGLIVYRTKPISAAGSPNGGLLTMHPNVPNPFSNNTVFSFTQVPWDGRDQSGLLLSSGIYLARVQGQGQVLTSKMYLMR